MKWEMGQRADGEPTRSEADTDGNARLVLWQEWTHAPCKLPMSCTGRKCACSFLWCVRCASLPRRTVRGSSPRSNIENSTRVRTQASSGPKDISSTDGMQETVRTSALVKVRGAAQASAQCAMAAGEWVGWGP